jgi:EAL domain-containing protein (putative c-di-GMP-specific phosphodiesterase class I)
MDRDAASPAGQAPLRHPVGTTMKHCIQYDEACFRDDGAEAVGNTVLVVDDDAEMSHLIQRVLAPEGYEVLLVDSGAAALDVLARQPIDVVVSDIHMPGMTGLELLRKIHAQDADLPVILMTGVPKLDSTVGAIGFGAFQYLVKPVLKKVLIDTVDQASRAHCVARRRRAALRQLAGGDNRTREHLQLDARFERALRSMWVAYQPIVHVPEGRIYAYEALLRSEEPSLPTPDAVIGAAEKLGRLHDIGRRVRRSVARSSASAPKGAALFVNLHARDLLDPDLFDPAAPLSKIASRVVLEVTERVALDGMGDARGRIDALRAMGFRVAVDDLGAGYAGLSSFAALEPEVVKLDRSLVRDVHQSSIRERLIASMVSLCKEMNKQVIAEGVETRQELETLRNLGCDLMQGFYFSRPGPFFVHVNVPS